MDFALSLPKKKFIARQVQKLFEKECIIKIYSISNLALVEVINKKEPKTFPIQKLTKQRET